MSDMLEAYIRLQPLDVDVNAMHSIIILEEKEGGTGRNSNILGSHYIVWIRSGVKRLDLIKRIELGEDPLFLA